MRVHDGLAGGSRRSRPPARGLHTDARLDTEARMPSRGRGCGSSGSMRMRWKTFAGWLRTVVSRVCLDMLRTRASRRGSWSASRCRDRESWQRSRRRSRDGRLGEPRLLVVLDMLAPAERIAFVLHDMLRCRSTRSHPLWTVRRQPRRSWQPRSQKVRGIPQFREVRSSGIGTSSRNSSWRRGLATSKAILGILAQMLCGGPTGPRCRPGVRRRFGRGCRREGDRGFGRNARFAAPALVNGAVGAVNCAAWSAATCARRHD